MGAAPGPSSTAFNGFVPPKVRGLWSTRLAFGAVWFFVFYRIKVDGPHHFLHHHPWQEPKMIAHLEEVDKKYGTRLALDNMHH
ncbi:hypothetical protein BC829DRAFT_405247 [Chytridium lagenaria]|nr:hypothetical protein BC829DRAFT_405247 [Chytridium lagenaria]